MAHICYTPSTCQISSPHHLLSSSSVPLDPACLACHARQAITHNFGSISQSQPSFRSGKRLPHSLHQYPILRLTCAPRAVKWGTSGRSRGTSSPRCNQRWPACSTAIPRTKYRTSVSNFRVIGMILNTYLRLKPPPIAHRHLEPRPRERGWRENDRRMSFLCKASPSTSE